MTSEDSHSAALVDEVYHKAYSDLNELHQRLPEGAVIDLAREVLKRLAAKNAGKTVDPAVFSTLGNALIAPDATTAARMIDDLYKSGIAIKAIYLDYLAPTTALLGEWWETDQITFADVTVGTGRIYAIMRSINRRSRPEVLPERKSAFFATVPDDDHVLGMKMAVDLARKAGWEIEARLDSDHDRLVEDIAKSGELLIGLSAGGIHALPNLARLVLALRISAPVSKILVSGHIVDLAQDQIELLQVDGIGRSFEEAMTQLETLWQAFQEAP
jgi:methanogenic corrinoid protein MtbC1